MVNMVLETTSVLGAEILGNCHNCKTLQGPIETGTMLQKTT